MPRHQKIVDYLKQQLTPPRFQHCFDVGEIMRRAASIYQFPTEDGFLAGLLHDITKEWDLATTIAYLQKHDADFLSQMPADCQIGNFLHGATGAYEAKRLFNLPSEAIFNAIRDHAGTVLDAPIFSTCLCIADVLGPVKSYQGQKKLEKLFFTGNLELTELLYCYFVIDYQLANKLPIHPVQYLKFFRLFQKYHQQIPSNFFARED